MLKEMIKSEHVSSILKILLKNQLAFILDYPSYEILAASDDVYPEVEVIGRKPEEVQTAFAKYVQPLRKEQLRFRVKGITSTWLVLLNITLSSPASLYKLVDTPIFHNNKLVGIVVTITNVTMENLHLANWIMHINSSTTKPTEFIKYQELSELEKEVLFFSALGKSTKQISSLLNNLGVRDISNATINSLISQRIYKKLDVQNLSDAISIGIESNQINSIPDSLLMSKLKPYYLIDTKKDCIIL